MAVRLQTEIGKDDQDQISTIPTFIYVTVNKILNANEDGFDKIGQKFWG